MKSCGIGGQAVMEGIMMKNGDEYAIAVRKPDGTIDVHKSSYTSIVGKSKIRKVPIIRGAINFIDSLYLGMKCLSHSAKFFDDEEADLHKEERKPGLLERIFGSKAESIVMGFTVVLSIVMAVAIFMVLPYFISGFLRDYVVSDSLLAVIEGVLRLLIFLIYIFLISRMKDIQRTFMYHGAEHKCINCIENGLELNTKNVRKSSREHRRCGTGFLLIVMIVSIIFYIFIRVESPALRVVVRLLLLPLIAGVSYEFIRLSGNSDNKFMWVLSRPGMWLQRLTTREPDRKMMEVAIAAVEAVFDWKEYHAGMGIYHDTDEDEIAAWTADDAYDLADVSAYDFSGDEKPEENEEPEDFMEDEIDEAADDNTDFDF